jgi:nucleoid DNA-binding protein
MRARRDEDEEAWRLASHLGAATVRDTGLRQLHRDNGKGRKVPMAAKQTTKLGKAMNKSEILTELAGRTEVAKKDVARVLDALAALIERHIEKRSVGTFTLPGLLKVKVVQTPARPARKGVPNPFRPGETMDVAAKPARRKVKILPLKKLKAMIASA